MKFIAATLAEKWLLSEIKSTKQLAKRNLLLKLKRHMLLVLLFGVDLLIQAWALGVRLPTIEDKMNGNVTTKIPQLSRAQIKNRSAR